MEKIIIEYISIFLALMIVLPVHEFAHAFAAVKSGDFTPKLYNRYTLNPLAHFDLVGLVCFAVVGFGWAKPVPVNPNNFNNYRRGCFFVAIAGVLANLLLAIVACPLLILSYKIPDFGYFTDVLQNALLNIFTFSITFSIFNLLPIYPLDGFRVLDLFVRKKGKVFRFLRDKGMFLLYGLLFLGILADVLSIPQLDILGVVIRFLYSKIAYPIYDFWLLIL